MPHARLAAMHLVAKEERCPLWAAVVPVLYLVACAAAARSVYHDGAEMGVSGVLAAVGLFPAFAIPAVFGTSKTKLGITDDGLLVGSRSVKLDDIRLQHAERGTAKLHVVLRGGQERTFRLDSYKEAQRFVAMLPPGSLPAGALAA